LPSKLLYKFEKTLFGCIALRFSNNGKYLASSCINEDHKAIINVFSIENEGKVSSIGYHHEIAHSIRWSVNDKHIMSCSSDCTLKIWKFKERDDNFLSNDTKLHLCTLNHPSYVYACEFVNTISVIEKTKLYVISGCHDGKIRLWMVNIHSAQGEEKFKLIYEIEIPQNDV